MVQRLRGSSRLTTNLLCRGRSDVLRPYALAIAALEARARRAAITGVFLSSETVWGLAANRSEKHGCVFNHFYANSRAIFGHALLTAGQAAAARREDYGMLQRALAEFNLPTVQQAVALLNSEQLYRGEKCLGVAKWLEALHTQRASTPSSAHRENLTWLAVATAPVGFAHVRSTMIGTLLEDLASGMSFDVVSRRFAEKMNPGAYRRAVAPPSVGQIQRPRDDASRRGGWRFAVWTASWTRSWAPRG